MTPIPDTNLAERARFPLWARDVLRYGDTDRQGHVNNAVFATFCETGRVQFLIPLLPVGCSFVIARLILDYRAEIMWPGEVDIGTTVLAVGRSSFTLGQGLFVAERCVASAQSVMVLTDDETRRSTPLPEALRARLVELTAG